MCEVILIIIMLSLVINPVIVLNVVLADIMLSVIAAFMRTIDRITNSNLNPK
jgi:hypothetical protein